MKKTILYTILFFSICVPSSYAQNTLTDVLKKYNTESVPYITVNKLKTMATDIILLDAREKKNLR